MTLLLLLLGIALATLVGVLYGFLDRRDIAGHCTLDDPDLGDAGLETFTRGAACRS